MGVTGGVRELFINSIDSQKNSEIRKKWVRLCGRADTFSPVAGRVCSYHFSQSQYARHLKYELLSKEPPAKFRLLKPDAVPDINLPKRAHKNEGRYRR